MDNYPYNYTLLRPIQEEELEMEHPSIFDHMTSIFAPCAVWYNNLPCCSIYMTT